MARSKSPRPPISLMDIFIGSGRTIRKPTGLPGTHLPRRTELVQVRPSTSARKSSGDSKPAAAVKSSSNKENAASGSKSNSKKDDSKPSSNKEDVKPSSSTKDDSKPGSSKSDSKPNSKKEDSKSNSRPTSAKAPSDKKATDDKKADTKKSDGKKPKEPQASGSKPQANAQQSSDIIFTAEEDAKLLLMKTNGDDWKDIAAAINKTKKQTTRRFGEIKPDDWKLQKGGKHGIDKEGVVEMKKDKPSEKQLSKVDKNDNKAVESRSKTSPVKTMRKHEDAPTAILSAGRVQHQHDVRLSHAHHHDHHVHLHRPHESRPRHHTQDRPRHRTPAALDLTDSGYASAHHECTHKSHRPRPAASIAASAKTTFTIKTMPSLSEDDLFSFGELQALSELIGKDMEGMWHRVSAAFFGMTGRRISAEDIKEKFAGLEVE